MRTEVKQEAKPRIRAPQEVTTKDSDSDEDTTGDSSDDEQCDRPQSLAGVNPCKTNCEYVFYPNISDRYAL